MSRWLGALLLALCACEEGVGRAIVGPITVMPTLPGGSCVQPQMTCEREFRASSPFVPPALPRYGQLCGSFVAETPCATDYTSSQCTESWVVPNGLPAALTQYVCVFHDVSPAPGVSYVPVFARRDDTRIVLHATTPTTFELIDADLRNVEIIMRGPITLVVGAESNLRSVSIQSDDAVTIDVLESLTDRLYVLAPQATVRVTRSRLNSANLFARNVTLESVILNTTTIAAERMVGLQVRGEELALDTADTSLSEVELRMLSFARCDTAILVNARLSNTALAPCTKRLNVESSGIDVATAYGPIETHDSTWRNVTFGSGNNTPTQIELWGGSLTQNTFCPGLTRVALYDPSSLGCNDCRTMPEPEARLCETRVIDDGGVSVEPDGEDSDGDAGVKYSVNINCPQLDKLLIACNPQPESSSPF